MDLLVVVVASLVSVPLAVFCEGNPASLVLGLIFALFSSGYSLVAAIFPRRDDLDIIWRLALGFGLSIAVVVSVGVILNFAPWGISLYPVLISLLVFIIIASAGAYYRRRQLPPDERFEPRFGFSLAGFRGWHLGDKLLLVLLILVIIGAVGTLVYVARPPDTGEAFTEFYLLGPEGRVADYPDVVVLGEEAAVKLGVVNQERVAIDYYIRISIQGQELAEVATGVLAHGEGWEQPLSFAPTEVGEKQKVEIQLYKGSEVQPCHTLDFWIDVVASE